MRNWSEMCEKKIIEEWVKEKIGLFGIWINHF